MRRGRRTTAAGLRTPRTGGSCACGRGPRRRTARLRHGGVRSADQHGRGECRQEPERHRLLPILISFSPIVWPSGLVGWSETRVAAGAAAPPEGRPPKNPPVFGCGDARARRSLAPELGSARPSCDRDPIASFRYELRRWFSIVFSVRKSACAISRFVSPSAAIRATRSSLAVSVLRLSTGSRRGRAPAATSSSCARLAAGSAPQTSASSRDVASGPRAATRRPGSALSRAQLQQCVRVVEPRRRRWSSATASSSSGRAALRPAAARREQRAGERRGAPNARQRASSSLGECGRPPRAVETDQEARGVAAPRRQRGCAYVPRLLEPAARHEVGEGLLDAPLRRPKSCAGLQRRHLGAADAGSASSPASRQSPAAPSTSPRASRISTSISGASRSCGLG